MRLIPVYLLAIVAFSSCKKMKDPVFNRIDNVRIDKVSGNVSRMTLDMAWFNPNKVSAKLKDAQGEAWMDNTYLGRFFVDSAMTIPANADFIVPVKLDVEMKNLLKHSLAALMDDQVTIRIKGNAKVGKSGIYRSIPLQYEGKQDLQELFK